MTPLGSAASSASIESKAGLHASGVRLLASAVTRRDTIVAGLLLSLVSFSLPGREAPGGVGGLDLIAVAKLGIRVAVATWFGVLLLVGWRNDVLRYAGRRGVSPVDAFGHYVTRAKWTSPVLLPWWCFLVWSMVTITWSPLLSVSLGQWLGLLAMVTLAQVISRRWSQPRERGLRFAWQQLLIPLNTSMAVYSLMVITVHVMDASASGLDRVASIDGNDGMFHPTAVGATSSLGLVLSVLLIVRRHTRFLAGTCLITVLQAALLYLSKSRSALAMALVAGMLIFLFLMSWRSRAILLSIGGPMLLALIVVDPGLDSVSLGIQDATAYVARGQTADQLRQVSGRTEMWQAISEQVRLSPWIGHGYFVTSHDGQLEVWNTIGNQDAHNVFLQSLVSTGVIGLLLFCWAVAAAGFSMVGVATHLLPQRSSIDYRTWNNQREFFYVVVILAVWFAGWTIGCTSFLGPIRPEVVVFFVVLGLLSALSQRYSVGGMDTRSESSA